MRSRIHPLGLISSMTILSWVTWAATAAAQPASEQPAAGAFKIESNLGRAGQGGYHAPARDAGRRPRRETRASATRSGPAVLLLDDGRTRAAIVTFDLIAAGDDMVAEVGPRRDLREDRHPRENILVGCLA